MIKLGNHYWSVDLKFSLKLPREQKLALYQELKAACPTRSFKTEAQANKALDNLPANLREICRVNECTPVYLDL